MEPVRESSEVLAVKKEVGTLPNPIKVDCGEAMELAQKRVMSDDIALKSIHARLDDSKKRARAVWQDWNDLINEMCEPFEKDKEIHTKAVRAYIQEEQRKAEEEERRLREEARKLEEERRLAEMMELEKEGKHEEAEGILAEPITFVAPTVQNSVPAYDKRVYRQPTPRARVVNLDAFILWVSRSRDRYEYILVNEKALNTKAKALGKDVARAIDGIEYFED